MTLLSVEVSRPWWRESGDNAGLGAQRVSELSLDDGKYLALKDWFCSFS